jgi:hypothetical protein
LGLWQTIRGWFIREDEPGLGQDDQTDVSSVQYPRPPELDPAPAEETVEEQKEDEGFR